VPSQGLAWGGRRCCEAALAVLAAMSVTKLAHAPLDCISRVRFAAAPGNTQLLVSSWDTHVRLYDARSGLLAGLHKNSLALLDCTFLEDTSKTVSVGLEKRVVFWDFQGQQETTVGMHDAAIRCVEFHRDTRQIFTGSWDRTARTWDLRVPGRPVSVITVGTKVFCMDVSPSHLVVGGADRKCHIYDLRMLQAPIESRESSLKHQIKAVRIGKDPRFYASSSVEGRVAIEYLDAAENESSRYAFKCHRVKDEKDNEVVHPVNALAFHPVFGTFATGGSDGGVCTWDAAAKKRLWRLNPFETAVSTLSFSEDGKMLAIGVSYTFDDGPKTPAPVNELVVRHVADNEVLPKAKK